jgi:hypothetical protein
MNKEGNQSLEHENKEKKFVDYVLWKDIEDVRMSKIWCG